MSEIVILGSGPSLDFYRPEAHPGAIVFAINAVAAMHHADFWVAYDHQAFKAYAALVPDRIPVVSLRRNAHLNNHRRFLAYEDRVRSQPQGSGHMALELAAVLPTVEPRIVVYGLDFSEIYDPASPERPYQYASCLRGIIKTSLARDRVAPPPAETRHYGTRFTSWPNYRKQMRAIAVLLAGNRLLAGRLDSRGLFDLTKVKGAGHDCGWSAAHREWRNLNAG